MATTIKDVVSNVTKVTRMRESLINASLGTSLSDNKEEIGECLEKLRDTLAESLGSVNSCIDQLNPSNEKD